LNKTNPNNLKTMVENQSIIEPLIEKTEAYGTTSLALIKLKSIDKIANFASSFGSRLIAIFSILMFLMIASFGLAFYLGEQMEEFYYGFYVVAGGYGLLGLVLYFVVHNRVKKGLNDSIISQLLN